MGPLIDLCKNAIIKAPVRSLKEVHDCFNSEHLIDYWLEGNPRFVDTTKLNHSLPDNHRIGHYHQNSNNGIQPHHFGLYPFDANFHNYVKMPLTGSDFSLMRLGLKNAEHVITICQELYNFVKSTQVIGANWTNEERLVELYAFWVYKQKLPLTRTSTEKQRAQSVFNINENAKHKKTRRPEDYTSDLDIVNTMIEPYTSFGVMALMYCGGEVALDKTKLRDIVSKFRVFPAALAAMR